MKIRCRGEVGTLLKLCSSHVATINRGKIYDYEIQIRTDDGRYIWLYDVKDSELEVIK